MKNKRRKGSDRVEFEKPFTAWAIGIDGSWRRECALLDISNTGARLKVNGPSIDLSEFFLMLSQFSRPVFRRCKGIWVDGELMGVDFNQAKIKDKTLKQIRGDLSRI